jgi:glycosyltransferase involved in cell wall biosynthesis
MRILMVSEDVPYASMGGLAKHALNLARALVRAGHTVDFLGGTQYPIEIAGDEGEFGGQFIGALSGHLAGWKERRLGIYIPYKRSWLARRFARIIADHAAGYDVVHYHGHVPNLARYLPAGINFLQTRHDQGSDCLQHTRFRNGTVCTSTDPRDCAGCIANQPSALQRVISTMAVRRFRQEVADSFQRCPTVFVSDLLRRHFCRSMGDRDWGIVIHNFIDLELLRRAASQPLRLPDAAPVELVVVGKIYPPKGINQLVELFFHRQIPGFRLLVVGDGPELKNLRTRYDSPGIHFLGWRDGFETLRLTAGADAVVVPSVCEESCATTVFEGLLLGKTVFALARGGTPELACYAAQPEQLRLYGDLPELVDDLARFTLPTLQLAPQLDGAGSAAQAVEKLLPLYQRALDVAKPAVLTGRQS